MENMVIFVFYLIIFISGHGVQTFVLTENVNSDLPVIVTMNEQVSRFPEESVALQVTTVSPNGKLLSLVLVQVALRLLSTLSVTDGLMVMLVDIDDW